MNLNLNLNLNLISPLIQEATQLTCKSRVGCVSCIRAHKLQVGSASATEASKLQIGSASATEARKLARKPMPETLIASS